MAAWAVGLEESSKPLFIGELRTIFFSHFLPLEKKRPDEKTLTFFLAQLSPLFCIKAPSPSF
jgi:hypothetical protein